MKIDMQISKHRKGCETNDNFFKIIKLVSIQINLFNMV